MLSDEEVAVVEGGGCESYDGLSEGVSRKELEDLTRVERRTSLSFGLGSGIVIFSSG